MKEPVFNKLASVYGLRYRELPPVISEAMNLNNNMMLVDATVVSGVFTDSVLQTVVFYHEVAHFKLQLTGYCDYCEERTVWKQTLTDLKLDGITVPYSILKECIQRLNSYKRD